LVDPGGVRVLVAAGAVEVCGAGVRVDPGGVRVAAAVGVAVGVAGRAVVVAGALLGRAALVGRTPDEPGLPAAALVTEAEVGGAGVRPAGADVPVAAGDWLGRDGADELDGRPPSAP
jgi:hypothetical protein